MNLKKILVVALAVAVVGAASITAMAAGTETSTAKPAWGEKSRNSFDKLVSDGVISQATCEKMQAYLAEHMPQKAERPERENVLDKLLGANIITQAEYDAMKAAMHTPGEKNNAEHASFDENSKLSDKPRHVNIFDRFTTDGVISEQTAAAITEYLKVNLPDKTKIKERVSIFSDMLDAGVITQAEYNAIKAALPERSVVAKQRDNSIADNN